LGTVTVDLASLRRAWRLPPRRLNGTIEHVFERGCQVTVGPREQIAVLALMQATEHWSHVAAPIVER
jgi:hypothetical protein